MGSHMAPGDDRGWCVAAMSRAPLASPHAKPWTLPASLRFGTDGRAQCRTDRDRIEAVPMRCLLHRQDAAAAGVEAESHEHRGGCRVGVENLRNGPGAIESAFTGIHADSVSAGSIRRTAISCEEDAGCTMVESQPIAAVGRDRKSVV